MPVSFIPANGRWRADGYTALSQLNAQLKSNNLLIQDLQHPKYKERWDDLGKKHEGRVSAISKLPNLNFEAQLTALSIGALLGRHLPSDTVYIVEAATCAQSISDQLRSEIPGSWINAGGTGIGWSNGVALGAKLGLDAIRNSAGKNPKYVCHIMGDGSYMCGSPASAAWVAAKYKVSILTVVLNNGDWNAPRNSTLLAHPDGPAAEVSNEDMNISFFPSPRHSGITLAASGGPGRTLGEGLLARTVAGVRDFEDTLKEAIRAVEAREDRP
ncbi:hypothetical protein OIDMADRAFT_59162 [Oidiodendron maius Zn]|uniref:Thiamine pyrophosphate enzyme TPP-binding domain-containing protein n=1 Tax=Oidiodendron maius (strain Zn) TaxID=913774 RepID=A0A0C3GXX2_OIDMZ|nr:hypothetical protein OIDMADRAFT_59162 [Oidiodendron maius Zn]